MIYVGPGGFFQFENKILITDNIIARGAEADPRDPNRWPIGSIDLQHEGGGGSANLLIADNVIAGGDNGIVVGGYVHFKISGNQLANIGSGPSILYYGVGSFDRGAITDNVMTWCTPDASYLEFGYDRPVSETEALWPLGVIHIDGSILSGNRPDPNGSWRDNPIFTSGLRPPRQTHVDFGEGSQFADPEDANQLDGILVSGNRIDPSHSGAPIVARYVSHLKISNNHFNNLTFSELGSNGASGWTGIESCRSVDIGGNTFHNIQRDPQQLYVLLVKDSTEVFIHDNEFELSQSSGDDLPAISVINSEGVRVGGNNAYAGGDRYEPSRRNPAFGDSFPLPPQSEWWGMFVDIDALSSDIWIAGNFWNNYNPNSTNPQIRDASGSAIIGFGVIDSTTQETLNPEVKTYSLYESGSLSVGAIPFKIPFTVPGNIVDIKMAIGTAPTGADVIVDVLKNGTSIFPTSPKPSIADGAVVGDDFTPDTTEMSRGDYLTFEIDQVGSSVAGSDLTIIVEWTQSIGTGLLDKTIPINAAIESESAIGVLAPQAQTVVVTQATETESSETISPFVSVSVGAAVETETPGTITPT